MNTGAPRTDANITEMLNSHSCSSPAGDRMGSAENRRAWVYPTRAVWLLSLFFCALLHGQAQTLFDAALGTLPEEQGWSYLAVGNVIEMLTNDAALLDSSGATSTHAGWGEVVAAPLNRTNAFTLLLSLQLRSETHNNTNRAGFSLIVLGDDKRGIELGFWTNEVFAQADSPLFTHAEDASLATTNAFAEYALTIRSTNYLLQAGGLPLLSGPVRDYTAFDGIPDPYQTADLIFFGDDTGSAAAAVEVREMTLIRAPTLAIDRTGVIVWQGVQGRNYTVEASSNLTSWAREGTAISVESTFRFTNSSAASSRFFRVVFP
jgi:hypothetical protein